jgi:hypothetical protein
LWNGYPLLFSDTGAFLHQTLGPLMIWDKPWTYGPLLHLFHWRVTLWLPMAAQALLVSHLLWLTARALGVATPLRHAALCAALALLTTAPWSVALLMPDILGAAAWLALFLLGFAERFSRAERVWLVVVATFAIAAHLSHIPLALAAIVLTALLARRLAPVLRVTLPLLLAALLLIGTNWVGHGRASLSPHGSTFLLARLIADGPAARTIAAECPARGWYLCAWAGRLPSDSDEFLWDPASPVNRDAGGAPIFLGGARISDEARGIVAATLVREPYAVLLATTRNTLAQLVTTEAGDTLIPDHLREAVRPRIAEMNAAELARYDAARQPAGAFRDAAAPFRRPHALALLAATLACGALLWRRRRDAPLAAFLVFVLVGCAANAAATGGLSKPHHRYQARIAWLIPFAAMVALLPAVPREPRA